MAPSAFATDDRDAYPPVLTVSPKGVNLQTGRFVPTETDFSIGPFTVTRSHGAAPSLIFPRSGGADQPLGYWGLNIGGGGQWRTRSTFGGGSATYIAMVVDGNSLEFESVTGGLIQATWSASTIGWRLVPSGSTYYVYNKSGDKFTFDAHSALPAGGYPSGNKVLTRAEYGDGHRIDYSYNSYAQVKTAISNRGYALVLDYNSNGLITSVCGYNTSTTYIDSNSTCVGAPVKVSYGYTYISTPAAKWLLTSVIGADGSVVSYTHDSSFRQHRIWPNTYSKPLLTCMTIPNSSTCAVQNTYGLLSGEPNGLVKADQTRIQLLADGSSWRYDYGNDLNEVPPQPNEQRLTDATMTDPAGRQTFLQYDRGLLQYVWAPTGYTSYLFNGIHISRVTFTEGNAIAANEGLPSGGSWGAYELTGWTTKQTLPKSGTALTSTRAFPSSPCDRTLYRHCDKPLYVIDERGNQTDYSFDPNTGLILTETLPAVNGVRPQTRYTYGQRYAWVKTSGGSYAQAASPVWVLTQKSICKTGAASGAGCAIGGDEVRTTYEYGPNSGPNNLTLRGVVDDATGLALRTCYSYDWQGNKLSETKPKAGLGSCP